VNLKALDKRWTFHGPGAVDLEIGAVALRVGVDHPHTGVDDLDTGLPRTA
jgi:hypothetical protein